jgi:hypothetical protein
MDREVGPREPHLRDPSVAVRDLLRLVVCRVRVGVRVADGGTLGAQRHATRARSGTGGRRRPATARAEGRSARS